MSDQMYSHDELVSLAHIFKVMKGEDDSVKDNVNISTDEDELIEAIKLLKSHNIDVEKEFGLVKDVISTVSEPEKIKTEEIEVSQIAKTGFTLTLQLLLPGGAVARTLYLKGNDRDCITWVHDQFASVKGFGWALISGKGTLLARRDAADLPIPD